MEMNCQCRSDNPKEDVEEATLNVWVASSRRCIARNAISIHNFSWRRRNNTSIRNNTWRKNSCLNSRRRLSRMRWRRRRRRQSEGRRHFQISDRDSSRSGGRRNDFIRGWWCWRRGRGRNRWSTTSAPAKEISKSRAAKFRTEGPFTNSSTGTERQSVLSTQTERQQAKK